LLLFAIHRARWEVLLGTGKKFVRFKKTNLKVSMPTANKRTDLIRYALQSMEIDNLLPKKYNLITMD